MTDPESFGNTVMSPMASYKAEGKTYYLAAPAWCRRRATTRALGRCC